MLQLRRSLAQCNETEASAVIRMGEMGAVTVHWQIGALVLVAWLLCEHVARPLWEEVLKTPFPIDRYCYFACIISKLVPCINCKLWVICTKYM